MGEKFTKIIVLKKEVREALTIKERRQGKRKWKSQEKEGLEDMAHNTCALLL